MAALLESCAYNETAIDPWWRGTAVERAARVSRFSGSIPSDQLIKAAGLDFEPIEVALQYESLLPGQWRRVGTSHRGYIRSDTGDLLSINGSTYRAFRNADLIRVCDALTVAGKGEYLVAGVLDGGRRVWAQLALDGQFQVEKPGGTRLDMQHTLLSYNTHDGSSRLTLKFVMTMVVCANTAAAALSESSTEYRVKHTERISDTDVVIAEAAAALGLARDSWAEQESVYQQLAVTPFGLAAAKAFFDTLLTDSETTEAARVAVMEMKDKGGRSYTIYARKRERLVDNFANGLGNDGTTMLDALQAVTQAVDHQEFRSTEWLGKPENFGASLNSSTFGSGATLKQQAVQLLQKWA